MDPWPWVILKLLQVPGDGSDLPVRVGRGAGRGFLHGMPRFQAVTHGFAMGLGAGRLWVPDGGGTRVPGAGPALRLAVFPQGPLFPQLPRWGFGECSQEGLGLHGRGGSDL